MPSSSSSTRVNDRTGSSMLAAKVGAIRWSSGAFKRVAPMLQVAEEELRKRSLRRATGIAIGRNLEEELDAFAAQRVELLMRRISEAAGVDLRAPSREPSLRFLKGDVAEFMAQSAKTAAERDSSLLLRAHARTVARSGASKAHNSAVLAIARANKDVVQGVMALATLDDRTTELCRDHRHGGAWSLETGEPLPWSAVDIKFPGTGPYHFNCRTTLTPILFGEDLPEIQDMEREEWVDSPAGREAIGDDAVDAFLAGRITFSQMLHLQSTED